MVLHMWITRLALSGVFAGCLANGGAAGIASHSQLTTSSERPSRGSGFWCRDGSQDPRVELALAMEKPAFRWSEAIRLAVIFKNRSRVAAALATPLTVGFCLHADLERNGQFVPQSGSTVDVVPGHRRILPSGQTLKIKWDLKRLGSMRFEDLGPGSYTLTVCYMDPQADAAVKHPKQGGSTFFPGLLKARASFEVRE